MTLSLTGIGEVLQRRGNLTGALQQYRKSLAIREWLAAADPSNMVANRRLSINWDLIGVVLTAQANLPGAMNAYRARSENSPSRRRSVPPPMSRDNIEYPCVGRR